MFIIISTSHPIISAHRALKPPVTSHPPEGAIHGPLELNTLRLRQNGPQFPDYFFKCIVLNENIWILIEISLKFVRMVSINNIPALVLIMAWRRPGEKPLSESMMASSLPHICITRSQWVNNWEKLSVDRSRCCRTPDNWNTGLILLLFRFSQIIFSMWNLHCVWRNRFQSQQQLYQRSSQPGFKTWLAAALV